MTVYVEIALIENFLISFILLTLTAKVLKIRSSKTSLIIASLVGAIFAVLFPLILVGKMGNFALKTLLCIVMTKLALGASVKRKKLLHACVTFLGLTFALGGVIYACYAVFEIKENSYSLFNLSIFTPLSITVGCIVIFYKLFTKLLMVISKRVKISKYIFSIKLCVAGKREQISAYYDSGNRLIDKQSGLPINILSVKLFSKLCPNISIADVILEKQIDLKNAHFVSYEVVGARKKILVFEPDEFLVLADEKGEWNSTKCLLGVALKNFNDTIDYDMLLNGGISMEGL